MTAPNLVTNAAVSAAITHIVIIPLIISFISVYSSTIVELVLITLADTQQLQNIPDSLRRSIRCAVRYAQINYRRQVTTVMGQAVQGRIVPLGRTARLHGKISDLGHHWVHHIAILPS